MQNSNKGKCSLYEHNNSNQEQVLTETEKQLKASSNFINKCQKWVIRLTLFIIIILLIYIGLYKIID